MTTARLETWTDTATPRADATTRLALRRSTLWGILAAKVLGAWGLQWDIEWHVAVGRDSFWIPPHLMTYSGVTLVVLLSFGVLAWETWRRRGAPAAGDAIRVMGVTGTPGFHLAAAGIAITVLAAPIDDLWHRLFGLDVTIWSPPHLLGLLGSLISSAACLRIAGEVYPDRGPARTVALALGAALLLGGLATVAQPAFLRAYADGGVAFHLYAILGALGFPLAYVTAARLSGLRGVPVLVACMSVAIGLVGAQVARVGFDIMKPVSVIEEEIAKAADSPIAIATAIARKNGEVPGARSLALQLWTLVPVLVMAAVDPRRRPRAATIAYGAILLAMLGQSLARSPAFAPMAPGAGATLVALILTLGAAIVASGAACRLATVLDAGGRARS